MLFGEIAGQMEVTDILHTIIIKPNAKIRTCAMHLTVWMLYIRLLMYIVIEVQNIGDKIAILV